MSNANPTHLKQVADAIRKGAAGMMKIKGDFSWFDEQDNCIGGVCAQGALCHGADYTDGKLYYPLCAVEKITGLNSVEQDLSYIVDLLVYLNDGTELSIEEIADLVEQDGVLTYPNDEVQSALRLMRENDAD